MRHPIPGPVFSSHQAAAAGWTPSGLRHAVLVGALVRPRRGWYAGVGTDPELTGIAAAAAAYPDGVVSHRSAARLHGLPIVGARPSAPEMTFLPRSTGNRHAVKQYRASLRPHDVTVVDGVTTTSVARTLVDIARHGPIGMSVAMLDAALHNQTVTADALDDVAAMCRVWPRIRRAKRAIALADARAESPLESVSRLTMRWIGVPAPALQVVVFDQYGRFVARTDFYWDEFGVVGEADGRMKYDSREALLAEKERQELLDELGLVVTRWQWELPTRRPHAFKEQLTHAFERGLARRRAALPKLWSL